MQLCVGTALTSAQISLGLSLGRYWFTFQKNMSFYAKNSQAVQGSYTVYSPCTFMALQQTFIYIMDYCVGEDIYRSYTVVALSCM